MDAPDIEQLILDYVKGELTDSADSQPDLDDNLLTGGYVDSVAIVRLIAHMESSLGIRIPPPDLVPQNFRTVRIMAAYLAGRARV